MNSTTMNVHTVRRLTTRLVQINGQWHREVKVELYDDASLTLALYADDPACLALVERPDDYMRIPDRDVEIERSDKPFDMHAELKGRLSSANSAETSHEPNP